MAILVENHLICYTSSKPPAYQQRFFQKILILVAKRAMLPVLLAEREKTTLPSPMKGGEKMGTIPRFNSPGQFDHFCKLVLRNEAINYLQEMKHRRNNETVFSALSQAELDKLSTTDHYPSDSYVFSSYGCDLPIENERVAEAFASLSPRDQSILILHCVLDLTDKEIGWVMGLSRSAVQKRRTGTLKVLRSKLTALVPGGGD